ncbi:MAG: 50S ribosomal protein L25 [Bacteroidota bacterium]
MKTIELKATNRPAVGKRNAKDLRTEGLVPGVVYHQAEAKHIQINSKEVKQALFTPETYLVKLDVEGEIVDAIVREAQFHPVFDHLLHVDFLQVSDDKPVVLTLPLKMKGTPVGVTKGGKLATKLRKLKVKGIPGKLPAFIEVNVGDLDLGQTRKVGELDIKDIEVVTSPSAAIAAVEIPRSLRSKQAAQ